MAHHCSVTLRYVSETSDVTTPGIKALSLLPETWAVRMNSGKVAVRRGWMHLAPRGTPDIVGARRGRMFACETKVGPKEKLSDDQERVADEMRRAGIVVYRANSVEEVVGILLREIP